MVQWLLQDFDFTQIRLVVVWWVLTYGAVLFAMFVDLISGLRKAKKEGIATTSKLLKKSCDKAIKYFFPMLCLMPIDIIASNFLPVPVFVMLMAAFNIFCEWKSIMEKSYTKKEMHEAAQTVSVIVKNKDDLAQVLGEVMHDMADKKGGKNGNTKKRK